MARLAQVAPTAQVGRTPQPRPPVLAPPNEPASLLASLRRLAGDDPDEARAQAPDRLAAALSESWHGVLDGAGVTRSDLAAVLVAAQREIWLWVMGQRTWQQLVQHLAGRAERHLSL